MQPHLGKAFEGLTKVRFDKSNSIIEAIMSAETECVDLKVHIDVNKPGNKGAVERWLCEVETEMMNTLREIVKQSNNAYAAAGESGRASWTKDWPGQVLLITDCIYWSAEVEAALKANALATSRSFSSSSTTLSS